MLYKLEQRNGSLVIPTALYNFLSQNRIDYTYDFKLGGIQLTETAYNDVISNFKPDFEKKVVNCINEIKTPVKTQNKHVIQSRRRKLL